MEFLQTLLPDFCDLWITQCTDIVEAHNGIPPHIATPVNPGRTTYAYPDTVGGAECQSNMNAYLQVHDSDLASRFVVLRYLWAASVACVPPDSSLRYVDALLDGGAEAAQDAGDEELRTIVRSLLIEFVDRLPPKRITSPKQAMWEFKQAVILWRPNRLKSLAQQYRSIADQSADQSNLMLARALWLLSGHLWASFVYEIISGSSDLPWETFIENGDPHNLLFPTLPPHSGPAAPDRDSLVDVIACLQKVTTPKTLGPHWGILADCWLSTGRPDECAKIWEEHGLDILKPAADSNGRRATDILSLPDYQLPIADLWAECGSIDKEVEVLESLRQRRPRLAGVNRRLAERYQNMSPPDLERAAQRIRDEAGCDEAFSQDGIVRLFLDQSERTLEAERQVNEARQTYESSFSSSGQRTAIRNVLGLAWTPLDRLSHDVQEDWITGLWWCYGDHPQIDEVERGEYAVQRCTRAVETHLRETLFEPLREMATESEKKQLPNSDSELRSYLLSDHQNKHIGLGPMLAAIAFSDPSRAGVYKKLWDLLSKRSSKALQLRSERWDEIRLIRNPSSHESRRKISGLSIEAGRHCAKLCHDFLSTLESPPSSGSSATQPGRPIPRR